MSRQPQAVQIELIDTLWNVNNKKWGGTWERIKN